MIRSAGDGGYFVPVLGFELSCLPQYNKIPRAAERTFGQQSVQLDELARERARIQEVSEYLPDSDSGNRVRNYLRHFARLAADPVDELPSDDLHLIRLRRNVAALACALTRIWSVWNSNSPTPLGSASSERIVPLSAVFDDEAEAVTAMKRSLDCCAQLYAKVKAGAAEATSLHTEWIYEKLLFLASQVFDPVKLWDEEGFPESDNTCTEHCCRPMRTSNFRDRHRRFVSRREQATNWYEPGGYGPFLPSRPPERLGLRQSHLFWLQGLIRHLLLCGTRAYRTREELAFLLSLDDRIAQLPDIGADPFEVGLLYGHLQTDRDMATLTEALRYSEGSDAAGDAYRMPQVFYWALARFLKKSRERVTDVYHAHRQVILSMCLDREMERALAREFDRFRVAIPVNRPTLIGSTPGWLIIECKADRNETGPGYRVVDHEDAGAQISLEHEGPLLVKMFGSPLEWLPARSADDETSYSHRLVLDETTLLSSLDSFIPADIPSFLARGQFFFFGQNAIRWSERVPYSLRRTVAGAGDVSRAPKAVSIGETGVFGASALERLNIVHTGQVRPERIIEGFILEVAKRG